MDEESLDSTENKFSNLIKKNILIFGLLTFGSLFLLIGIIQLVGQNETKIEFEEGTSLDQSSESKDEIKVDVDGAVVHPGLYTLDSGARLFDAIEAAGGLEEGADRKAVNLAAIVTDGQKIYVPQEGETVPVGQNVSISSSDDGFTGLISINSASEAELDTLPGIGPVTAGKIIDARPYGSVDELREKGAVGEKTFEKIKDLISL